MMVRNAVLVREKAVSHGCYLAFPLLCGGFSSSLLVQFQLTSLCSVD